MDADEAPLAPSYWLTRFVLLRLLGLVYFFAFLSLATQVLPLLGSHGLLPVPLFLERAGKHFGSASASASSAFSPHADMQESRAVRGLPAESDHCDSWGDFLCLHWNRSALGMSLKHGERPDDGVDVATQIAVVRPFRQTGRRLRLSANRAFFFHFPDQNFYPLK